MLPLELRAEHLQLLLDLFTEYLPQAEVWAYGSRVTGACHEASDLDLVARNPGALEQPLDEFFEFKELLVESHIPILIDLVDWARIPQKMRAEIERDYVVVRNGD